MCLETLFYANVVLATNIAVTTMVVDEIIGVVVVPVVDEMDSSGTVFLNRAQLVSKRHMIIMKASTIFDSG